jgi:KDO2-lipid IV(A) lauroyltransferase
MQNFTQKLVFGLLYALSLLPLRVLYVLSDFEFLVVYYLLGYRRQIVRSNLTSSFPEKSVEEIKRIERRYYRWFCDYFFESIKLLSISEKELRRRFTINNSEEVEAHFQQGQSVGAMLGHYCNWEWLSCVGIELPKERIVGLIYKPLRAKPIDYVFHRLRSHMGGVPVPKNDILRYLVKYKRAGVMTIFGYIADQGPRYDNIHLWLPFLNHDTGVFTGAERIMRKMQNAVFYVEMSRPRRGYYTCTYHLMTSEPQALPEYELTRRFFQLLEEQIRRQPEFYLWSHNRWKRTHEEYERMIQSGEIRR